MKLFFVRLGCVKGHRSTTQMPCGLTGTRTCTSGDYADQIYDTRRRNFWEYACPWQFASGNSTFGGCCRQAQPNARTEPQLQYAQPNSYAAYMQGVHNTRPPPSACRAPLSSLHEVVGNALSPKKVVVNVLRNDAKQIDAAACQVSKRDHCSQGAYPWSNVQRRHVRAGGTDREGCVSCAVVPVNGGNRFAEGCAPQPVFKRRMAYNAQVFKPASRLPVLDRYQWAQPESLYYFDSPEEYAQAFDAIYNGNVQLNAKFHFQNPGEQTRLWSGIPAPTPRQCPTNANARAPVQTCGDVPVPYYRNYLQSARACACNRQRCACDGVVASPGETSQS